MWVKSLNFNPNDRPEADMFFAPDCELGHYGYYVRYRMSMGHNCTDMNILENGIQWDAQYWRLNIT